MKIFLDVGAYHGISASAATAQRFAFDKIVCFEPSPECIPYIEAIDGNRITVMHFGLWNDTTNKMLYSSGHYGASIFADKPINNTKFNIRDINLVKASTWVNDNISKDDVVFMKMNCEGCECDIIDDLIINNQISKLYSIMVDFDVGKIPSMKHREIEIRKSIWKNGIDNVCFSEDVMIGDSHEARIHYWLDTVGASEALPLSLLKNKYGKTLRRLSRKRYRLKSSKILLKNIFGNTQIYGFLKYARNKMWKKI